MEGIFSVLIIEDDFRVADINRQYVENTDGFIVKKIASSGKEALSYLDACECIPDIILLDIFIPDVEGLDLLWDIRQTYHQVDIIIVSAEKEAKSIHAAFRGGIFDYIVKPVDDERFRKTLLKYKAYRSTEESKHELEQSDIDRLMTDRSIKEVTSRSEAELPKGIDSITLDKIIHLFSKIGRDGTTAIEVSSDLGISRSTARRYLEYLVSLKKVETKLIYGTVGRPQRKYVRCEAYEHY
ncbi:response regulator [Cytobacillus purgationiresistens]|uniref:Response regulator of citrate/malate metabolism n=1 Tax=Cytobacillus purgationiresistens TaxID=863449 RepID=A0ABU0AKS5_9BACI|nr:response regulator [Cytobacillus purgationiresistens]MDQ0271868.1 response regulator of citrate/malate metabolism [Cytobacillus purgationiresistens]